MPSDKELPDPEALAALCRLREHFELTLKELQALLELPGLPPRFAGVAATIDLLERLRATTAIFPTSHLAHSTPRVPRMGVPQETGCTS